MLYNKNQFRKTNDKKVLHKIGKHWVTVSVAFLSLLGLGAVSTTATTHADTTDNANAQTTSAAPNSNSADSIQKQVTKQANALHNQLLGHAAVSQKPAQQGTARLGSVNGRVNQTQNAQQNNKPAVNNQMSANHSNVMRLGASQNSKYTYGAGTDPNETLSEIQANDPNDIHQIGDVQNYDGLNYKVYSDTTPKETSKQIPHMDLALKYSDWSSDEFGQITPNVSQFMSYYPGGSNGSAQKWFRKYYPDYISKYINAKNNNKPLNYKSYYSRKYGQEIQMRPLYDQPTKNGKLETDTVPAPIHNYRIEFINGSGIKSLYELLNKVESKNNISNVVSVQFDSSVDTSSSRYVRFMLSGDSDLRTISGLSNLDTSNVGNMQGMFESDSNLRTISGLSNWKTGNVYNMTSMFSNDSKLQTISDMSYYPKSQYWNLSNVPASDLAYMFSNDKNLSVRTLDQIATWRFQYTGSYSSDMFYNTGINNSFANYYVNSDGATENNSDGNGNGYITLKNNATKANSEGPRDTDWIIFKGDPNIDLTKKPMHVSGADGQPNFVNPPMGYKYTDPNGGKFTNSNKSHTFNVTVSNEPTVQDKIEFKDVRTNKVIATNVKNGPKLQYSGLNYSNASHDVITLPGITEGDYHGYIPSPANYHYVQTTKNGTPKIGTNVGNETTFKADNTLNTLYVEHNNFQGMDYDSDGKGNITFINTQNPKYDTYQPTTVPASESPTEISMVGFSMLAKQVPNIFDAKSITFDSDVKLNEPRYSVILTGMFRAMPNLEKVDMSKITSIPDVYNMGYMFANDSDLQEIDFPKNMILNDVSDMSYLFYYDSNLRRINFGQGFSQIGRDHDSGSIAGHNASDVNMAGMFQNTPLLLTSDNSSYITNPNGKQCGSDNSDMSDAFDGFDTSHAGNMDYMFSHTGIQNLTLPRSFNTSNVTSMKYMFSNNSDSIETINFGPSFNTSKVNNMEGMFQNFDLGGNPDDSKAQLTLTLPSTFDTSNVSDMKYMFQGDRELKGLVLPSSFNTKNVTDMSYMFNGLAGNSIPSADKGAEYYDLDLSLPENFYIDGKVKYYKNRQLKVSDRKYSDMFLNTGLHSLTLASNGKKDAKGHSLTNTKFNDTITSSTSDGSSLSPTDIIALYQQEPTNQYGYGTKVDKKSGYDTTGAIPVTKNGVTTEYMPYTVKTPHDFSTGLAGTYMPKNMLPTKLAFSDYYGGIDGGMNINQAATRAGNVGDNGLAWRLPKDQETWGKVTAPHGWTFVDENGHPVTTVDQAVFHKNKTTGSDRVRVAPVYHGLELKYNASNHTAEFVNIASDITSLKNFDNISDVYNGSDNYGEKTIDDVVKNASTIQFDGTFPNPTDGTSDGIQFSNISDMSYMFANPNLRHLVFNQNNNDPIFDSTNMNVKPSDIAGMFQGAQISDLTLPVGFNDLATGALTDSDAFADKSGKPSQSLKKLTINSSDNVFYSDAKLPTLYRVLNGKDGKGNNYTENKPTNFSDLTTKDAIGTYVATPNFAPVSDTINLQLTKKDGSKVTLKQLLLTHQPADSNYTVSSKDVPAGYELANKNTSTVNLGNVNKSTFYVPIKPKHMSDVVQLVYAPKGQSSDIIKTYSDSNELDVDPFAGNDSIDSSEVGDTSKTVTNSSTYMPDGWQLDNSRYHSNSVTIPYDGVSHTIYVTPVQVHQTFYYQDKNPSDGADYKKVVGSSAVSGNSFAASSAGNNSMIVTTSNESGLSAGYQLMSPSDKQDDNRVEYTGVSDIYIPVEIKRDQESINYNYNNSPVNTSLASFKGTPAGLLNVANGMASGYHLASGASTTEPKDDRSHDVSVTPNTITENVNYAVQDNPMYATKNQTFSGFSSAIDDSRTKGKNKSLVINSNTATSDNYANVPNGFQVSGNYQFGPATTNSANSNSDHMVTITPDFEHMTIKYINHSDHHYDYGSDENVLTTSAYSGYAGNPFSAPLNVPAGYQMNIPYGQPNAVYNVTNSDHLSSFPTSFYKGIASDYVYVFVHADKATSHIQFVDASQNNKPMGGPISVTGFSSNVKDAKHTSMDITSDTNNGLIPKGYVLVNSDNPVSYNGQTYNIPVVPDNNNIDIVYQYNNAPVHSDLVHRTSPKASVSINGSYAPGLPAGYRLSDEHNVSDDNVFGYQQTSGNVNIVPLIQSDTINYQLNGKTIGVGHVSGNDSRAVTGSDEPVSDTTVTVTNQTDGVPSGYHVVQPKDSLVTFGYDGQPHNVVVEPNKAKDTVQYMYHGVSFGSDQILGNFGSDIDITNANTPDMPSGYHLVNPNSNFVANDGTHQVNIAPSTSTFTVNFVNNGKTVGTKQYTGATDTSFTVDGSADTPKGYTINKGQNMNYDFDGDETKDVANLNVTPIPPSMDTESINFIYSDANHQNHNEGSTVHTGVKGSVGTVTPSDYSALKSGWQIIPGENSSNKFFNYKFSDGSVNMFVEPIQQTEDVWFLNDKTGKLIGNDGPFSDTVMVTGNDYRAKDAGDNSFVIGATPNHLNLSYYKVDNPEQVIPFDGDNHGVNVHLVKEAPYSAEASAQAAKASASASASISTAASAMAKKTNASIASSYASSASKNAASTIPSQAANSVASTNDSSEYSHEQSANSSIASSASSSAAQSQSSKNNSLNSSIAGKTSSESAAKSSSASSVAPSSSAASVMPYIPFIPSSAPSSVSSSASSVASRSTMPASSSVAPVTMTNKNYPITYAKNANKPDMVTVMGRKYPVHYHANGKNTVRVRERITKNGKRSYRYKNVVVSTNVPTIKPSSDEIVREIDHIDFSKVNKHVWSAKGLDKVLNSIKPGEVVTYRGHTMARLNAFNHFRYFMITREALAHKIITNVGIREDQNLLKALKAHHAITIHITNIVVVHNKHANKIRYEFNFHHHNFWVTGRNDYTPNAYWQESELHSHRTRTIRVLRGCVLYTSPYFSHKHAIKGLHAGDVLHVKKAFFIGRHGAETEQTRFELTNHDIVTSNKNYVQLVRGRRARY